MDKEAPHKHIPYPHAYITPKESLFRAKAYFSHLRHRRSLRAFSSQEIPLSLVKYIVKSALCAPSGANKQPWAFCIISDKEIKSQIRIAAEKEEYLNYHGRMNKEWIEALKPLETDHHKPFLEEAPYLIVVFKQIYGRKGEEKVQYYYVNESVGLACGFLLTAIHQAGLVALTHTPSPMNFLSELLQRPENEKPFLLIPIGYPAKGAKVPAIVRKKVEECMFFY